MAGLLPGLSALEDHCVVMLLKFVPVVFAGRLEMGQQSSAVVIADANLIHHPGIIVEHSLALFLGELEGGDIGGPNASAPGIGQDQTEGIQTVSLEVISAFVQLQLSE